MSCFVLSANAKLAGHPAALSSLTLLLHGKKGVEELDTWDFPEAFLFSGDPKYITSAVKARQGDVDIDAYAIWVGGEAVLDGYAKHVKKVRRADADHVAEGIGMFASNHAVPLMLELAVKKCDRAEAWLLEHMDLARLELEKIAKAGKKQGERAQAILDQVGKGTASKGKKAKPSSPPTPEQAEAALDKLMDDLVTTIEKVRGNKTKEAAAFADAAAGYMEIRSSMDEPATEYMGHFFMVDGICLSQDRPTAWERLDPSEEESERWGKYLEKHELAD